MEKLVKDSEKCLILERKLMDKLLTAEEDDNLELFSEISLFFCGVKENTDKTIFALMSRYPTNVLANYLQAKFKFTKDTVCHLSLLEFINRREIKRSFEEKINLKVNCDCFLEEHIKNLYSLYVWYMRNHDLDEKVRKTLHQLMVIRLENSEFARYHFSGDSFNAKEISTPEFNIGLIAANELSISGYYEDLNKLIHDSNASEMLEGVQKPFLVEAQKHMLELEFATLCMQMDNRRIIYPFSDYPISDYTKDIMNNASNIYNDYTNKECRKKSKSPIYL